MHIYIDPVQHASEYVTLSQSTHQRCNVKHCMDMLCYCMAGWPNEAKVLDTHQPDYQINRDRHLVEDDAVLRYLSMSGKVLHVVSC